MDSKQAYKDAIEVSVIFHEGQRMFAVPKQPAPVHEDWGPGPHEYHSLPAPVRPVAWIDCKVQMPPPGVRVFFLHKDHDRVGFDTWFGDDFRWTPSHWMPIPPLTTTPSAQPAPVQEPVAWMHTGGHIQGRNPNWEQGIAGGYTRERGWTPLYTTPPAAPVQEPVAQIYVKNGHWIDTPRADVKGLEDGLHSLYNTPPAAQPAPDLQAELEATNRQVEILSDELAESRRELAALKAVQEPESFEQWNAKQHGDPEEIGFLQALRIAYCAGQDSVTKATPPAAQPAAQEFTCSTGLCHYKAQRQWAGLTDEEFIDLCEEASNFGTGGLIRHIEAKLKEKNQ
jgi:hypothetical protein